jgi:cyclase
MGFAPHTAHPGSPSQAHPDAHAHHSANHAHSHVRTERLSSRRDFLRSLMGTTLAGASMVELGWHRGAWARAAAHGSDARLFDLHRAAEGVFLAQARPQSRAMINCNAVVFVRSKDVVVVDAHGRPSAASALIDQLKREVTDKPVRYVINTHFHGDHTQGNRAYRASGRPVDFISSTTTKELISDLGATRAKASLDDARAEIEALHKQAEKAPTTKEKAFCADQIRQLEAYAAELKDYSPELPTITFDNSYLLPDSAFDLHLEFHGRAHSAGDIYILCPQRSSIATGDACMGWVPNLVDAYPKDWPRTLDAVGQIGFDHVLGGHGALESGHGVMRSLGNYIEELTGRVERAKELGRNVAEMQKQITADSLKSLASNGYGASLTSAMTAGIAHFGAPVPLQVWVNWNIADIDKNLDRA